MSDRHTIDFAQRLLPLGLVLIEQLAIPTPHGLAFKAEDRRLVSSPPVVRLIRVIEVRESEPWRDKWLSQLRELSKSTFHHVCRPLEMGAAGADYIYLVFDWFPATLAEQIPAAGLVNPRVAQSILGQLVVGLEELHSLHGAHGGLRAEHVFVDSSSLTEESRVWIGGVELGHLPYWTDGARLVAGAHGLFPPEWQGTLRDPSKGADVFALGLLAVELLAGRDARDRVAALPTSARECASRHLKQRWPWWKRPQFVPALLSQTKQRPVDGPAVKRRFDWWLRCERAVLPTSAVLIALLLVTVGIRWREETFRSERDAALGRALSVEQSLRSAEQSLRVETDRSGRLAEDKESLRGQFANARTELAALQIEFAALKERLDTLVGRHPDPPPPIDDKKVWSEKLAGQPIASHDAILKLLAAELPGKDHEQLVLWSVTVRQAWDGINHSFTAEQRKAGAAKTGREVAYYNLRQEPWNETRRSDLVKAFWLDFAAGGKDPAEKLAAITAAFEKVPLTSWLRAELIAYIKPLVARHLEWQRWEAQPLELTQPWRKRIEIPWDDVVNSREEEMLTALAVAEREWRRVDGRGDMTWSVFQTQLNTAVVATGNSMAMKVANVWINEFNSLAGPSGLSFQPVMGTSPAKSGIFRTFDVHIDGSQLALDDETTGHTWTVETSASYPEDTPPITAPWRPGQTLQIKVYGERQSIYGGQRSLFINRTFTGPIAVWRLAQAGEIKTGDHSLTLKVTNCPGPPPLPAEVKKVMEELK